MMEELKLDENTLTLIKIIEQTYLVVAALARKIEGFDTSTKLFIRAIKFKFG